MEEQMALMACPAVDDLAVAPIALTPGPSPVERATGGSPTALARGVSPVERARGGLATTGNASRPLRVMFVITCMPVGGAETLLVELIRRLDRRRFAPYLCCLKYFGPMGEVLAKEIPAFTGLLASKYDFAVLPRLASLLRREEIDAVITVGTGGDKMFWGRLAGRLSGVPVICSALHSTGLPDHVELPNRLLAPITDAFIGVAQSHVRWLAEHEGCPARKVRVIPNGVDTERFAPRRPNERLRYELGLASGSPVAGIVAALRPEKNHALFLEVAQKVHRQLPSARFLVVGDGPERAGLERHAAEWNLSGVVRFLGTRHDIPEILSLLDVFVLTSHMEGQSRFNPRGLGLRKTGRGHVRRIGGRNRA